jgi:uncharacterized protein (TIGR03382 family)
VRKRQLLAASLSFVAASSFALIASAKNPIQLENEKPVDPAKDNWLPALDPVTYEAKDIGINGTIDGYPSSWSYKQGDTLGLRVSTTSGKFRTRIYRIGWYPNSAAGPIGSRLVHEVADTAGERQPFPAENGDTGLAEANWHDSVTVKIGNDWTPGHYVVRFTTDGGKEGYTHFIVRDDVMPAKAAILYVDTLFTETAYDPWPKMFDAAGKQISGKSTYSYNSAGIDVKASGAKQAVEVSMARPRGENWGLSIWRDWTVPTVQFLEKYGFDVAYATSLDLHNGTILGSRKLFMDSGHDEYWTRAAWENLEAARNAGLNLAFFSGNDFTWQVRLEKGSSGQNDKMVAYKISAYPDSGRCGSCWEWGGDPEFQLALKAKLAGDSAGHIAHLRNVTYAWAGLKDWDPNAPSPTFGEMHKGASLKPAVQVSKLAIGLEGLMNGPKLPSCPAGAPADHLCRGVPWIVDNASHWVFTGGGVKEGQATGLADGDRIPLVVGYEMDNARLDKEYPSRPKTQVVLGHTDVKFTPEKGSAVDFTGLFNAQYYQYKNGAHVFSAGLINWFWGVEREGMGNWGSLPLKMEVKPGLTLEKVMTAMTLNVLRMEIEGPGTPPSFDPETTPIDPDDPNSDGGTENPGGLGNKATGGESGSCGCSTVGLAGNGTLAALGLTALLAALTRRRR